MTSFDDREKGFERKYIHDQELAFRINARRNKLLGLWAATRMGKENHHAEDYAREVAMADVEGKNHQGIIDKLIADFAAASHAITLKEILIEMERLLPLATDQVTNG